MRYFNADASALVQRLGLSLVLTLACIKAPAVAAGTLTAPLWWPLVQATARNRGLRKAYRRVGLWRARVLAIGPDEGPGRRRRGGLGARPGLRLLVGDDSGARTELVTPYDRR